MECKAGSLQWDSKDAVVVLEDGTKFVGKSFGAERSVSGEVVFNTGMVGYPESLTDPSYRGQILVLTYPSVGNYGVPKDDRDGFGLAKYFESDNIHITALVVADYSFQHSHWTAIRSLSDWLKEHNVPAVYGVDTREITKTIRVQGAMLGKIIVNDKDVPLDDPNKRNLVAEVSRKKPATYGKGKLKITAVDCGMKNNIIRYLVKLDVTLTVVPWDYDFTKDDYDGLFISNGPGNPEMAAKTVEHLKVAIQQDKPIFGICLGNQLLALAAGAKTYKMKFGNRGMNQPVIDLRTTRCYITPQNHGYAVANDSLPPEWLPFFTNANDYTNEGIIHSYKPFYSVQFHPEAQGGPTDTSFLFDMFISRIDQPHRTMVTTVDYVRPIENMRRVVLLGSGGLSIGQAGEFDYSGSQAIKALKEENVYVILVNPNIATVQTSDGMADQTYLLPVTVEAVSRVLRKEKPDGILLQFGGQTALNCGVKLQESGILDELNIRVLGTPIPTIVATEDRAIFAQKLAEIKEKVAPSAIAKSVEECVTVAERLGYPVLVRAAFALGGLGSGFAKNTDDLRKLARKAFAASSQVIIDKSLRGWKEVEYEVVRDAKDNCITVCNMENFDPLGIHTGDSIVVAPSQTLSNDDYYKLRAVAIKVIRHLGVIGECNIQYAVDPNSNDYNIIEVNARLSRSSALASKATGYPLAYVAAKLALGKSLTDVKNSVTRTTTACFEPALDYMVVKIPRWDLKKFSRVSTSIGSSMKSVGEVMAIGRTFEEAFQKAIRMVNNSLDGFGGSTAQYFGTSLSDAELDEALAEPSDQRVAALAVAFLRGYTVERIHELTAIDLWFLSKLANVINIEKSLQQRAASSSSSAAPSALASLTEAEMRHCKKYGLSDRQIGRCIGAQELQVRSHRKALGVLPVVKQIDTLAAEFPAQTNYLYMTYCGRYNDLTFDDHGVMVLGCGAYRIGSSCEFDWCAVSCIRTLRSLGHKSIMVNYNPETVSTDFDECDRLYFEELSLERVVDIYEAETSAGVIISVGGQIPNNLVVPLDKLGVHIFGTSPDSIDNAEDRSRFSALLDEIKVDQPVWKALTTLEDAKAFASKVGYPCLIRPSYVLSGAAMNVANNAAGLEEYLTQAVELNSEHPVVISKFISNAKEIEMDGVALNGEIINFAISEHVENAGVHSGDATLMLPAQKLYVETIKRIRKISAQIAKKLNITGPFNVQYISKDNDIKVIECNLRASRSFPFVSKTFNANFVELATRAMVGAPVKAKSINLFELNYVCCKAPMFSFTRLQGADPVLRVEMASTGEVACFGREKYEAFLLALMSAGFKIPEKGSSILVSAGPLPSKVEFGNVAGQLVEMGYHLVATTGTAKFLTEVVGVQCDAVYKPSSGKSPNVVNLIKDGKIKLVINVPDNLEKVELSDGYHIRRAAVDFSVPLISNIKNAVLLVQALVRVGNKLNEPPLSWQEFVKGS